MFTFQGMRDELYNIRTCVNSTYMIRFFRSSSSYNELGYELFTFARCANEGVSSIDTDYFFKMHNKKYHTIRMINVYEYHCLLNVLNDENFNIQGMTIDYEKKRLYFDSFEIAIRSLYEIYKKLGEIDGIIYSVRGYIEDFQFLYTNYTAILALIGS